MRQNVLPSQRFKIRLRTIERIGQVIPPEAINPNEDTLTTMRAYQPVLSFDKSSIAIDRLPSEILIPFPWYFCHVKGQLRKNFIIDGRNCGTGTNQFISINNLGNGPAVRLINDGQNNIFRYVVFTAANTSATNGVVFFSNTTGTLAANGNNSNTIDN